MNRFLRWLEKRRLMRWPTPCPRCGAPAGRGCFVDDPRAYIGLHGGRYLQLTHIERMLCPICGAEPNEPCVYVKGDGSPSWAWGHAREGAGHPGRRHHG